MKMCNDVLSTQLYFPSLTYFIHTHFSSQLTSEIRLHKDLQLFFFFPRYKTYITSFIVQTYEATWLIWETLRMEDDSRLYIFRLFYVSLLTFVHLCFEVIIQRIKTGPANLVSTNSLKFSFDKNFFSQEKCFN